MTKSARRKERPAPLPRVDGCDVLPGVLVVLLHFFDGFVIVLDRHGLRCSKDEATKRSVEGPFHIILYVKRAEPMVRLGQN